MKESGQITLRKTQAEDLEIFFEFQLDEEANCLAAFTQKDPTDRPAYIEKYTKLLYDPTVNNQTILIGDNIVGNVGKFVMHGDTEITYWVDKKWWGRGVATKALQQLLMMETHRPVFGHVAFDNIGSQKVLERCGFKKIGTDRGFANARGMEIEEFVYRLD